MRYFKINEALEVVAISDKYPAECAAVANDANKAAVRTAAQAKLGDTGVDVAEVTVYAMAALGTAGALTMLKRRGEGRYDMMARHAK